MDNEISIYEYWLVIKKHRSLILKILGATIFFTLVFALFSHNRYKAETSFYYPLSEKQGQITGAAQSLNGNGDLDGITGALLSGIGPSLQNYTKGILESRAIADLLINRFNLMEYYHAKSRGSVVESLRKSTGIEITKEGIMKISVETTDPKLSADLANGYVDVFRDYSSSSLFSIAKKHRIDVENRLAKLKDKLHEAEKDMVAFQAAHKTVDFTQESEMLMKAIVQLHVQELSSQMALQTARDTLAGAGRLTAEHFRQAALNPLVSPNLSDPIFLNLRGQLADIYVKYAQAKATETPANPELQSYKAQMNDLEAALRDQLKRQILATARGSADYLLDPQIKVAELTAKLSATGNGIKKLESQFKAYPVIGLQYLQKTQNLKVLESLYIFLSTEYEKAKLNEAKETPDLQVLDKAVIPDHKSGPHRSKGLIIGFLLGTFLGVGAAFLIEAFKPPAPLPVSGDGREPAGRRPIVPLEASKKE